MMKNPTNLKQPAGFVPPSPTAARCRRAARRFLCVSAIFASILFAGGGFSALNSQSAARGQGLSRSMEQAIRLYNEGKDNDAMDRFMDILVNGTPSEKSLANEYISKITLRMNTGVHTIKSQGAADGMLEEVGSPKQRESAPRPAAGNRDLLASEEEAAALEDPEVQRDLIGGKINEKIAIMRRDILLELNKLDAVKIYMGDPLPRAVTIDPKYFFASETVFKAGAASTLADLAGLLFTLGRATVLILPEGSVEGDVKIKSIRQAIALNSYLVSRGLSPARIDVNLTGTDIKFPKELTSISGMILLLSYDKQPKLTEPGDSASKAPKISLGVYPTAISLQKNEGSIVEFSVFKSPIGQISWKFEIFSVRADNSLVPLQKTDDTGPLCRQSYWNGRKNFFGVPYPSGKYMFSLTATDVEGHESNLRRFLVIKPSPAEEKALAARASAPAAVQGKVAGAVPVKTAAVPARKGKTGLKGVKPGGKSRMKAPPAKKPAAAAPPKEESAAAEDAAAEKAPQGSGAQDESQGEFSGQVSYKIYFREKSTVITPNSDKQLAKVAETMNYYPMAQIKLIGYAYSGESDPETMARSRVDYVATRLSSKYKVESTRMDTSTEISDSPSKTIVEIKMLGKE